jgi:hypothetical protein
LAIVHAGPINEMTMVRHYALAAIFITPLTILLAEAATPGVHVAGRADPGDFEPPGHFSGGAGRWHLSAQPAFSRQVLRLLPSRVTR